MPPKAPICWVRTSTPIPDKTAATANSAHKSNRRIGKPQSTFLVPRRARNSVTQPCRQTPIACESSNQNLHLQLVSVPDESFMLTPGEVRQTALDYLLFQSILQTGSTLFGCVNVNDWPKSFTDSPRGSLLSILSVKNLVQQQSDSETPSTASALPKVMVECRCSGRFDVLRFGDGALAVGYSPQPWTLVRAECVPVRDWSCWEYADRRQLAMVEWEVWQACVEVARLMRQLRPPEGGKPMVEQELAVWAPAKYDREITEEEWKLTPGMTREVWYQRAEELSFGILRCMDSDESVMRRARGLTSTVARFQLARESVEKRRAMTQAQLSLKNALN